MDIAGNITFQKIAFLPTAKIWIITNLDNRKISKTFGLEQFNGSDNKDINMTYLMFETIIRLWDKYISYRYLKTLALKY